MPKIFATVPGAEVRISHYGTATNDQPCLVPAAVAKELAHDKTLRIEPDEGTHGFVVFGDDTTVLLHGRKAVLDPVPKKKHHTVKE